MSSRESKELRIAVIGTSCSGKSTLAQTLAKAAGIPYIEQDALFWNPGWTQVSQQEFASKMRIEISQSQWTVCGNHSHFQEHIFQRATHILWLNYLFPVIFFRALKRTFRRVFLKETCCNGNRESFAHAFLSTNSILWWIIKTYRKRIIHYTKLKNSAQVAHAEFLELRSPKEADNWLETHFTSSQSVS